MCRSATTSIIAASVNEKGIVTLQTHGSQSITIDMSGKEPKGRRNVYHIEQKKNGFKIYTVDDYEVTFKFADWPEVMHTLADQAIAKVEALHERATAQAPRVMTEMADKIMGRTKAPKPVIEEKVEEEVTMKITPHVTIKVMR